MKKTIRRTKPKRRSHAGVTAPRPGVTRREYAEVVVRLGSVELQIQRNRAVIDLQGQRINQLQEQLNAVGAAAASQTASAEIPALPIAVSTPTVES
jgi:hypothetical protein